MAGDEVESVITMTSARVVVIGNAADTIVPDLAVAGPEIMVVTDHRDAQVLVLVDPGEEHWAAAVALRRPIVLRTTQPLEADAMLSAVVRGADAVIDPEAAPAELTTAILTVARGGVVLSALFTRRLADALRAAASEGRPIVLSRRERQILECIAVGHSVKQTGEFLGIAPKTVENLQTRLYRKLGVRNRNQALALARALGLIP